MHDAFKAIKQYSFLKRNCKKVKEKKKILPSENACK